MDPARPLQPRREFVRNWPKVPNDVAEAESALTRLDREYELLDLEELLAQDRGHVVVVERLRFKLFEKHNEIKAVEAGLKKAQKAWADRIRAQGGT